MPILHYLKRLHDTCLAHCGELKFDKKHALHFTLVPLYGSMLELLGKIREIRDTSLWEN